jgi:hypothetical protein
MVRKLESNTWQEDPKEIIFLVNRSKKNFILDLPSGRCRLDAGRRIRTLKSIMDVRGIRELVNQGELDVEFE